MAKKKKLSKAPVVRLQAGANRTLYATWVNSSFKNQDGYRVIWQYSTGQGVWFVGSDSTVKKIPSTGPSSTYSVPSNAVYGGVRVGVAPNPGSKAKWTGALVWTRYKYGYGGESTYSPPKAPNAPELTINGSKITVKLENYTDENANGKIGFQIVQDDNILVYSIGSKGEVSNKLGLASIEWDCSTKGGLGGHRYKARAVAYGKKKDHSDWSGYCANVYTAPSKPTIKELSYIADGEVKVTWDAMKGADSYTLQYTSKTVDGNPVFDTGSGDVQEQTDIRTTYFPATSLELGKTWYFRLKAVGYENAGDSEWSDVKSLPVGTKPNVPTVWSYTSIGRVGEPVVINWVHNSEDASEQSGAKICIKINDGEETIYELTGDHAKDTTYSIDTSSLSDSDKINWRVSTRGTQGITEEWSDYSEYREVVVYISPTITFSVGVPDEDDEYAEVDAIVREFPINISGTALPLTQTPVGIYISITANDQYDINQMDGEEVHVNQGSEVYSKYISAPTHDLDLILNPGDVYLNKDSSYTVTVTLSMSNGLTAESSQVFVAKWDDPVCTPDADIYIDKSTLTAYIRPFCSDDWEFEYRKGFIFAVYRIDFDGHLTLISDNIRAGDNLTVTDMHPALDYARYRIVATDLTTGVVSFEDPEPMSVNANCVVIQWEGETRTFFSNPDDWEYLVNDWSGTILRLPYNIDVSDDISPDVSLIEYIGRSHPVSYYGTQQGSTSRWTVEVPKSDVDAIAKIRALAIYPGDVYVREPNGTGYWANIKVSYNFTHNKPVASVTFGITRVEGGA